MKSKKNHIAGLFKFYFFMFLFGILVFGWLILNPAYLQRFMGNPYPAALLILGASFFGVGFVGFRSSSFLMLKKGYLIKEAFSIPHAPSLPESHKIFMKGFWSRVLGVVLMVIGAFRVTVAVRYV